MFGIKKTTLKTEGDVVSVVKTEDAGIVDIALSLVPYGTGSDVVLHGGSAELVKAAGLAGTVALTTRYITGDSYIPRRLAA